MESHDILDQHFRRERTPEEDSEFRLLKMDAAKAGRRIQNGRYALYVVCVIYLILGAVFLFKSEDNSLFESEYLTTFGFSINLIVYGGLYVGIAWGSFKYPKIAFGFASGIYILSILADAMNNSASLFQGIIFKIIIIYYFIKAFQGGLQMERIKKRVAELGATEEELVALN